MKTSLSFRLLPALWAALILATGLPARLQSADGAATSVVAPDDAATIKKLDSIIIPQASFNSLSIEHVVQALGMMAAQLDAIGDPARGVNLVLNEEDPKISVTMTVSNLSLHRVLDLITAKIGYQYEVHPDLVILSRSGGRGSPNLMTEYFSITKATVEGLAGKIPADVTNREEWVRAALKAFFEKSGVDFSGVKGSALAYDGATIIVTQTAQNVERIGNILARLNDLRQVAFEGRLFRVKAAALAGLQVDWGDPINDTSETPAKPPSQPDSDLGFKWHLISVAGAGGLEKKLASTEEGEEFAPKLVTPGNPAILIWAKELRYPGGYSSHVSPDGYTVRNIGVELKVAPTLENDHSISLDLNPRVTDFDGLIEYGGMSVAIAPSPNQEPIAVPNNAFRPSSASSPVIVPSGFFQPVFSTRETTTKALVPDGTTLVLTFPMRGLIKFDGKEQTLPPQPTAEYPIIPSHFNVQPPTYMGVIFLTVKIIPAETTASASSPGQNL